MLVSDGTDSHQSTECMCQGLALCMSPRAFYLPPNKLFGGMGAADGKEGTIKLHYLSSLPFAQFEINPPLLFYLSFFVSFLEAR